MSEESTIWVVVEDVPESTSISGARDSIDTGGGFGSRITEKLSSAIKKRIQVDAFTLKTQISGLVKVVGDVFNQAEQQTGMRLSEVEVSLEINSEGQVSLMGTGSKVSNKGGITLKFTRQ